MTRASNFHGDVCLEARIAATDLEPVRASVERWLLERENGIAWANDNRAAGQATFNLRPNKGGLSVFLRASGEDALQALGRHGHDLVGALGEASGEVALTWIRRPCLRCLVEVVAG